MNGLILLGAMLLLLRSLHQKAIPDNKIFKI